MESGREKFVGELVNWIHEFGKVEAERMFYGFMQQQENAGKFWPENESETSRGDCLEAWKEAKQKAAH